jgi:hypothetical protein
MGQPDTGRAISSSPAAVDQSLLESSRAIPPAGIVELVSFVSVLQMLHRLSSFCPTTDSAHPESAWAEHGVVPKPRSFLLVPIHPSAGK